MKHLMNLNPSPFALIKSGKKTVEMRLYDEKRRAISSGDDIEFTNNESGEKLVIGVKAVRVFKNFAELYKAYNAFDLGYIENEEVSPNDMYKYYSREKVEKYGVAAIELCPRQ